MGAAFANIYITADGKSIPALYKKKRDMNVQTEWWLQQSVN